ncbi:anti-sigma factor [Micromonospora sp. M12]
MFTPSLVRTSWTRSTTSRGRPSSGTWPSASRVGSRWRSCGRPSRASPTTPSSRRPSGLRERTLAQAARTPQLRVTAAGASGRRQAGRWRQLTVAAAAAVLVAGGASAVTWTVSNDRISDEQASSDQARQIAAVLDAPDARVFERPLQPGGAATVVVSRARDRGVVLLRDLPEPGPGRIYELWLIRGTEPARSVGRLAEGARASTTVIGPVAEAATFGVSNEPAGGSVAPPGSSVRSS